MFSSIKSRMTRNLGEFRNDGTACCGHRRLNLGPTYEGFCEIEIWNSAVPRFMLPILYRVCPFGRSFDGSIRLSKASTKLGEVQFRSRIGTTVPTSPHLPEVRGPLKLLFVLRYPLPLRAW